MVVLKNHLPDRVCDVVIREERNTRSLHDSRGLFVGQGCLDIFFLKVRVLLEDLSDAVPGLMEAL